ncbi:MAG: hypothetical protein ACI4TK_16560 [Agathobacter sp.]
MAEYLKRDDVFSKADILTVHTKEYGSIEAIPVEYLADLPIVDAVEVVRCAKCLHGRSIDKNKVPEKYFKPDCVVCECEEVVGDEPMIYPPTHYCSFGKTKGG